MDELVKEYVIDFFTKRLNHFKNSPESVGWTKKGQTLRYEAILKFINPDCKTILDFGCGKGDFYSFLKEKGMECNYTGIDINPSLIEFAKQNYPEAEFYTMDIENEPLTKTFDYIISIGVFNLLVQTAKETAKKCIKTLFNHTDEKLIFTCLNRRSKHKDIGLVYFDIEELINIALEITPEFNILDDVVESDLFLILYK